MLPEEVLCEILTWLSRHEWDIFEIVNRGLAGAIHAAMMVPLTVNYRFIDEVHCTGQDLVLKATDQAVHEFDCAQSGVLHFAYVAKFIVGNVTDRSRFIADDEQNQPSLAFCFALPPLVRTTVAGTLEFKALSFTSGQLDADAFYDMVRNFESTEQLILDRCLFKADFPFDALIHHCSMKRMTRITAMQCALVRSTSRQYGDVDISPSSIASFLAKDNRNSVKEMRIDYVVDAVEPIAALRHLAKAAEDGELTPRFRVEFTAKLPGLRTQFRHLYSAYYGGFGIFTGDGNASDMHILGDNGLFVYVGVEETSFKIYRNSSPRDYQS